MEAKFHDGSVRFVHVSENCIFTNARGFSQGDQDPSPTGRWHYEDGITVSTSGVFSFLRKLNRDDSLVDHPRSGRRSKCSPEVLNLINQSLTDNELSADDLQTLIQNNLGFLISLSSIKRGRRGLGWERSGTRYCQIIRDANRPKRLEFAEACLAGGIPSTTSFGVTNAPLKSNGTLVSP